MLATEQFALFVSSDRQPDATALAAWLSDAAKPGHKVKLVAVLSSCRNCWALLQFANALSEGGLPFLQDEPQPFARHLFGGLSRWWSRWLWERELLSVDLKFQEVFATSQTIRQAKCSVALAAYPSR